MRGSEFVGAIIGSPAVVENAYESVYEFGRSLNPFRHKTGYAAAHGLQVTPESVLTSLRYAIDSARL
jgi:hypothetical protein